MRCSVSERENLAITRFSLAAWSASQRAACLMLAALLLMSAMGCGSDGAGSQTEADTLDPSSTGVEDEFEGKWLITHPDRVYSVDDLVAAGWKKSDQLSTETLASATDVWYGFYQQKDIEIRFYESHETAVDDGVGPAQETVNRGGGARGGAHAV